jgi:hypothetical protein
LDLLVLGIYVSVFYVGDLWNSSFGHMSVFFYTPTIALKGRKLCPKIFHAFIGTLTSLLGVRGLGHLGTMEIHLYTIASERAEALPKILFHAVIGTLAVPLVVVELGYSGTIRTHLLETLLAEQWTSVGYYTPMIAQTVPEAMGKIIFHASVGDLTVPLVIVGLGTLGLWESIYWRLYW